MSIKPDIDNGAPKTLAEDYPMLFFPSKEPIVEDMEKTIRKLKANDAETLRALDADLDSTLTGLSIEDKRVRAIWALENAISYAKKEPDPDGHTFHSRDPLTGITQSHLAKNNKSLESDLEDNVVPQLQAFGQGNPIVWIPTGIDGILEHFKPKAKFKTATVKSQVLLPDKCKVALLADWGANNDHAKWLGRLVVERGADFVIHLGDIYYSGSKSECETFLKN